MFLNYDLENSPLQIKTDTAVGGNEQIRVWFFTDQNLPAGGISLYSTSQYWIYYCSQWDRPFSTQIPAVTEKVWKITLTRLTGGARGLVVHCNDVEVLNMELSDTTCGEWDTTYSKDVKKIKFDSQYDSASDYYRTGK